MADRARLFDYNTSFLAVRTNPALTGNVKITVSPSGSVNLNTINANSTLSNERFKAYEVTGKNSYAMDLHKFLDEGKIKPEILFDISKKTDGDKKSVDEFSLQYDFFYGTGASVLVDRNYDQDYSYFAPLWLREELPEYFVIFKVPGPLSYPYSQNVESGSIVSGKKYKVIKNSGEDDYVISYGEDSLGNKITYKSGEFFTGSVQIGNSYGVVSGNGKVTLFEELKFKGSVDDVESYFSEKVLTNASIIETFDLREDTKIGKYIRSIVNNPSFPKAPVEFNFGEDSYTYFNGVDYRNGSFGRAGELLSEYVRSVDSDQMIKFEEAVSSGFSRNGIISPNILNLEFVFDDETVDDYTINRYFGLYVSRNDLGELKMNGELYYNHANDSNNNNTPKPKRDNVGYSYSNSGFPVESDSGVRLYYTGVTGWIPGSEDTNINDAYKLYYLTDKKGKFHSLKRVESYSADTSSLYKYGTYATGDFLETGASGGTAGSLVISDESIDLRTFTGVDQYVDSFTIVPISSRGHAYSDIEFTKTYDLSREITFKFYWDGGEKKEGSRRYDLIHSGDYSGILPWTKGSYYHVGETKVFNPYDGGINDISSSLSSLFRSFAIAKLDAGNSYGNTIIRAKNFGDISNSEYSISVIYDYDSFIEKYKGIYDQDTSYSDGDIVIDDKNNYLVYGSGSWSAYNTFGSGNSGYGKLNGVDFSDITSNVNFVGGSDYETGRFAFSSEDLDSVKAGYWVQSNRGYSKIESITRYLEEPVIDSTSSGITGFKNFDLLYVANLEFPYDLIKYERSDRKVSIFRETMLKTGVFTYFDIKDFDFDFWSSSYGYVPTEEGRRYYSLLASTDGVIAEGIQYYVKRGKIVYDGSVYSSGDVFTGNSNDSSFSDSRVSGLRAIVVPAPFTQIEYSGDGNYGDVEYEENLDLFRGFYGIEKIVDQNTDVNPDDKILLFQSNKLDSEYNYLQENYNIESANVSRIVPYINKWVLRGGTDSRGNPYRLNSSPAFSPTNFSPSMDRETPDPEYLTHEWYLLENLPRNYPTYDIKNQKNYLPSPPDYDTLRDADPDNFEYFDQKFTVAPGDYSVEYTDDTGLTKEFFGNFSYNEATGFYEVVFRGVKYVLKRKSGFDEATDTDGRKFVRKYRGFEGYKFSTILKVEAEDSSKIQAPVTYEFIENTTQKFVLFVITVVVDDYRTRGMTASPDGDTQLDYTLLYSLTDKKELNLQSDGEKLNLIGDVKLSVGLDLSYSSGSFVNDTFSPGRIYTIPNTEFDSDLREEIRITYPEGSDQDPQGEGSFNVPELGSTYPWATGIAKDFLETAKISSGYYFQMPFLGVTGNINIPVGPKSLYEDSPVFQIGGGSEYYNFIFSRVSLGQVSKRINLESPYIKYSTYGWDSSASQTIMTEDNFSIKIESPSYYRKDVGSYPSESTDGPQSLGQTQITSYEILQTPDLMTDMLRFSGYYEPLTRKVIMYKGDKTDKIAKYPYDLSFRNATFAPNKEGFGIIKNLNYSKVSFEKNILSKSQSLPEGSVYPLLSESPIARKDHSLFYSNWDPGYYNLYTTSSSNTSVAGTRSMNEHKSFLGSKMMKTPDSVRINTFIAMEVSKSVGETDVSQINSTVDAYMKTIQGISQSQSGSGIGQLPVTFAGVDINKLDEDVFPNVEVFWQKTTNPFNNNVFTSISGIIRLDRMLRRYLLNSGVEKEFVDNMVSEFGVGDPKSIEDDVLTYIDANVVPIYKLDKLDLYLKKSTNIFDESSLLLRGDILPSDRTRIGYRNEKQFSITKRSDLIYEFTYSLDPEKYYSLNFTFDINKI